MVANSALLKIITEKEMKIVSSLPASEFQNQLATVKTVFDVAKETHAHASPDTIRDISTKLVKSDEDSPHFWAATSAVINYRSRPVSTIYLPACQSGRMGSGMLNRPSLLNGQIEVRPGVSWSRCMLDLNQEIQPHAMQGLKDLQYLTNIQCFECVIVYSGGPIPLLSGNIKELDFFSCAFDFKSQTPPPMQPKRRYSRFCQRMIWRGFLLRRRRSRTVVPAGEAVHCWTRKDQGSTSERMGQRIRMGMPMQRKTPRPIVHHRLPLLGRDMPWKSLKW